MAIIGNLSGNAGVTYITGALHLTGTVGANAGVVTTPYIAFETIASGSLTNVGGVTDKLHNRNGVLYFGAVSLQGGVTVANDDNANGVLTGDGDGTYSNEGNLEFDGDDLLIAGGGKVAFRDNGGEYVYSVADNTLGLAAGAAITLAATQVSASGMLYTRTGLFTSGMINTTGSLMVTGSAVVMGVLEVTGNADFNGTITCDDSITIDSVTITDTELGYLDGLTLGTVAASKVVTVDSNKDVGDFRNITAAGLLTVASITASHGIMPDDDNTQDLGSSAFRWRNIFTGDLHLANDRGNWTVIEESDYLSLRNNATGKRFKIEMSPLSEGEYGPGNDGEL